MIRLGILGGGQLACMTIQAAISFGIETATFERAPDSPASRLTPHSMVGDWHDAALMQFAAMCTHLTLENEFVDASALAALETSGLPVYPSSATLAVVQDKLLQKQMMQRAGIPLARFAAVTSAHDAASSASALGWPVVLKARRNGYDGYGNVTAHTPEDISRAWEKLDGHRGRALLVEEFVPFRSELAVMVVRGRDGECRTYPVVETVQKNHICHLVRAPAAAPQHVAACVEAFAVKAVRAVDGVGVFGVEFFLHENGDVLYNEIAPRPHNSGHYTIEACMTSQFENHIRAVLGWPLGSTAMVAPAAVMVNLLGERSGQARADGIRDALAVAGASVHVYGKREVRAGRKMGHITAVGQTHEAAETAALRAAALVHL